MDHTKIRQKNDLIDFLWESNAIEDVWDDDSFAQALKAWQYLNKQKKLTVRNILKTHNILMLHHLPVLERGMFRTVDVWVGGEKKISPGMVPSCMQIWIRQANLLEDEKRDHVAFETVHPFVDGNGRIGRILMNWQRIKMGKDILVIWEKEKEKYYQWF